MLLSDANAEPNAAFEAAHARVCALVEQFRNGEKTYLHPDYKEASARQDFLDPLFIALGWDVLHHKQLDPLQQEVKIEKSVVMAEGRKSADYAFSLAPAFGRTRFFCEAKKPSKKLANPDDCFQAIRYGWNGQTPLAALSDFEEFFVMDCRARPDLPSATTRILQKWRYTDWLDRDTFAQLYSLFGREAVARGSLERFVEHLSELPKGAGRQMRLFGSAAQAVDVDFLKQLETWREDLARAFYQAGRKAKTPLELDAAALTETTQRALDRLVFLRFLEDKLIETDDRVSSWTGGDAWAQFRAASRELNAKYNGVLWKPHPILDNPDFNESGVAWGKICFDVSNKQTPYLFNLIPIPILGSIYERFLGNIIEFEDGKPTVAPKPEVRKAGGVYYTPEYIVEYITQNTVGRLILDKAPKDVAKMKFADIACGSGSFLLGVYDLLLRWHTAYYAQNPEQAKRDGCIQLDSKLDEVVSYRLSLKQRRAILENNIWGADIDAQAVEVSKLSLYLKLLEDETANSTRQFQLLDSERILPNLDQNIVCGNSLVDFDINENGNLSPEEEAQINPMDWKAAFPFLQRESGKFDAIVGNPPWGAEFPPFVLRYVAANYSSARVSVPDTYAIFTEKAIGLLRQKGVLGYIVPDTWMRKDNYKQLRHLILNENTLNEIIETGPVFSQVRDTWCSVFFIGKGVSGEDHKIEQRQISRFIISAEKRLAQFGAKSWDRDDQVRQKVWRDRSNSVMGYLVSEAEQELINKIESTGKPLGRMTDIFKISRGEEGSKFALRPSVNGDFFMVIPADVEVYSVGEGLQISRNGLASNKIANLYTHPKIWITRIQKMRWQQRLVCAFDPRVNSAGMKTLQVIISTSDDEKSLKYLQGLLASRLMNFYCINFLSDDMNQTYLEKLPIRAINFSDAADKKTHDTLVSLVEQMLTAKREGANSLTEAETRRSATKIASLDRRIDELVYGLYGLSDEEIALVEA